VAFFLIGREPFAANLIELAEQHDDGGDT